MFLKAHTECVLRGISSQFVPKGTGFQLLNSSSRMNQLIQNSKEEKSHQNFVLLFKKKKDECFYFREQVFFYNTAIFLIIRVLGRCFTSQHTQSSIQGGLDVFPIGYSLIAGQRSMCFGSCSEIFVILLFSYLTNTRHGWDPQKGKN